VAVPSEAYVPILHPPLDALNPLAALVMMP
jgi:hypothetical protein